MRGISLLVSLCLISNFERLEASCLNLKSGKVKANVRKCTLIEPKEYFESNGFPQWIVESVKPEDVQQLKTTYKGILIDAYITESSVKDPVLGNKGLYYKKEKSIFIANAKCPKSLNSPTAVFKISGTLQEVCCDDGMKAPCLLKTKFQLKLENLSAGTSNQGTGNSGEILKLRSKALQAFKNRKYRTAAKWFAEAKKAGAEFDSSSNYIWGLCYYRDGRALKKAEAPLEKVRRALLSHSGKDVPAAIRKGVFLLARVYARQKKGYESVQVLREIHARPKLFVYELKSLKTHEDFGWIKSDIHYIRFLKEKNAN